MKKRKSNKLFKVIILLFGVSLLLWNFENNYDENTDNLSLEKVAFNYSQKKYLSIKFQLFKNT